jgi:hypothetical protein
MTPTIAARVSVVLFLLYVVGCRNNAIGGPQTPPALQPARDSDIQVQIASYYDDNCVPGYTVPQSLRVLVYKAPPTPNSGASIVSNDNSKPPVGAPAGDNSKPTPSSGRSSENAPATAEGGAVAERPKSTAGGAEVSDDSKTSGGASANNSAATVQPAASVQAAAAVPLSPCGQFRNSIVYDLKIAIDKNYEAYAKNFEYTFNTISFAGDVGGAALSAVGTLAGTSELKDILSTASTLTQSTNASIQKDFYQKQTQFAILAQMDADRLTQWSAILQKLLKDDVQVYPLAAALNDLLDYKRVGTAVTALTSIEQKAGAEKSQSKDLINDKTGVTSPSQNAVEKKKSKTGSGGNAQTDTTVSPN